MKDKWPTLEGRLKHAPTSRGEALLQMKNNGDVLTELGERYLTKYLEEIRINQVKKQHIDENSKKSS